MGYGGGKGPAYPAKDSMILFFLITMDQDFDINIPAWKLDNVSTQNALPFDSAFCLQLHLFRTASFHDASG
jgi:hypothetical protein